MLADRITVLRDGARVLTQNRAELDSEKLVQAMVGREVRAVGSMSRPAKSTCSLEKTALGRER